MMPHHVYYELAVIGFLWLCLMLHYTWPSRSAGSPQLPTEPATGQSPALAFCRVHSVHLVDRLSEARRLFAPILSLRQALASTRTGETCWSSIGIDFV
jgi:hypothetical protein